MQQTKNDVVIIEADKHRISQVLSNLISNAIKFTKDKGVISISVDKQEATNDNNNDDNNNNNGSIIFSIKDTGIGIDPEVISKLFSKFITKSDKGGTGLGLYISKSIIDAHGGRIWAENNNDGKGATFSFSLPIVVS